MFEPLIFSDLDGTLIFSASRKQPGDIVCEYKDNREISCITKRQAELLPGLTIIPVTTRSIEQYRRIRFPEGFSPEYALTDNGGTLLVNGVPDPEWARRTMRLVQESSRGWSAAAALWSRISAETLRYAWLMECSFSQSPRSRKACSGG